MRIAHTAVCGALLGVLCLAGAQSGSAQDMDQEQMIQSLQQKSLGKTRGLRLGDPEPAGPDISKELSKLKGSGYRSIVVEEREKIAEAVKELPAVDVEVFFEYDSDAITKQAVPSLVKLGGALSSEKLKTGKFLIAGHTDAAGSAGYNLDLSARRADSVKQYLVETFQIDPERLTTIGFGFEQLKDAGDPLSGVNRRVQVVNVEAASVAGR